MSSLFKSRHEKRCHCVQGRSDASELDMIRKIYGNAAAHRVLIEQQLLRRYPPSMPAPQLPVSTLLSPYCAVTDTCNPIQMHGGRNNTVPASQTGAPRAGSALAGCHPAISGSRQ